MMPMPRNEVSYSWARSLGRSSFLIRRNPGRQGGWDQVDVPLLQGVGRTSMGVLEAVRAAKGKLDSLAERLPTEQDRPAHPASLTAPLSRTVAP
jgi:hypothetical protein